MKIVDWLYKLIRWVFGGIFIYAGSTKLLEPEIFATLIEAYGIVPEGLLMPVAIVLPVLEVFAGAGLLFDIKGSLSITAGLLVLFVAVLSYGIWMGLDVDCGCFGKEDPESRAFHGLKLTLYRDMVMITGVAFIYGWRRYRPIIPVNIMMLVDKYFFKKRKIKNAYL
ncbi:MAG: DoxX family membrane protein [Desulfobacterales bacterium]|nr:DoxX family membrane protein [Desulfobacterales bacterium]